MSSTLGEKLRQAREERGISISEVSEQTRISSLYLAAIENDNYKTLPGGIFNKGFVKSYAKFIGFDEQEALQDYSQLVTEMEGTEDDHLKTYRPEVLTDDRSGPSILPTAIFAGVMLTLMTVGILFLVRYIQNRPSETPAVSNTSLNSNVNAPANSSAVQTSSSVPAIETIKVEFRTSGEPVSVSAVNDGKVSSILVTPDKPAIFEPKQLLRLKYSKSLAQAAQLMINGKPITLPAAPENPKRAAIEFDIHGDNLARIWQEGAITFAANGPASASEVSSSPASTLPQATPAVAPPSTPRPTANPVTTPVVRVGTPIPARTPIVVGNAPTRPTPRPNR
ncbi:MAG: helix-turn-helix domain-containing protein [Saprospiraceae bacterium]|nr:helix-turn-helix domain-containing protein [Pyrinomonadaceae bacterium]